MHLTSSGVAGHNNRGAAGLANSVAEGPGQCERSEREGQEGNHDRGFHFAFELLAEKGEGLLGCSMRYVEVTCEGSCGEVKRAVRKELSAGSDCVVFEAG